MRRLVRVSVAFILIFAIATIVWSSPALAAGEGIISGQVVNKTPGGSGVGALTVTLTTYLNGQTTLTPQKTTADPSGKFEFEGLSVETGITYTVGTTFHGADYVSPPLTLTAGNPAQTVQLDIYDATTSDENIQASNGHIVVFADPGALQVIEVWRFNNIGTKTFVGAKGGTTNGTLEFMLPAAATGLDFEESLPLETTATGAAATTAIPPGVTDINFRYQIPYEGERVAIARVTDYPTADFRLLVGDTGVKVTSTALKAGDTQDLNGTKYLNFTAGNLARGTILDVSFSGITHQSAGLQNSSKSWPWLLGGMALLGLMGVVAYSRLKKRQADDTAVAMNISEEPASEAGLLREIARLDDEYEAGNMKEAEYRLRRARAKASLLEIHSRSRGG